MKKTALVTGASSGIGRATAIALSKENFDLILCGRNADELQKTASMLDESAESVIAQFDVADREAVDAALSGLATKETAPDILINNAGNAHGLSTFHEGDLDDFDAMMDINVKGLMYVARTISPGMVARGSGHIVNISSIAGKEVYENGVVYCASKWAVEALSLGMRKELIPHGIKVTNIAPGAVNTNFSAVRFKGDTERADGVYKGFDPLLAENIADAVRYAVTVPANVQIADMTILAGVQSSATGVVRS